MLKKIIARPVTIVMIFIAVAVFGLISYNKLPVNLMPNIKYPSLVVWTEYSGNSPEEVEHEITEALEAASGAVKGIKDISSSSKNGISLIRVNFEWGTDMDFAVLSLREKLDAQLLPDMAGRPNIIRVDPAEKPIIGLSITGDNLYDVRITTEQVIKRRMEQIDGIAMADIIGGEEKEIRVEINLKKMNNYNISFNELSNVIKNSNIEQRGGTIKDDVYLYDLRISSQFQNLNDIRNTLIKQLPNGRNIFIKDVAIIKMANKEKTAFTRYNSKESVGILVRKDAGANAVLVSNKVNDLLKELKKDYPKLTISKAFDQADFIQDSINNVIQSVLFGGVLAFLTLFFFLRNFKAPFNIALSIPISIFATFSLLYFSKISLNLMSLSGLALGVGMLVDNSIVILENITRYKEMGFSAFEAAVKGAKEVSMPVTASTITTIIVFMPIVFVSGVAGELFKDQSISVTFSLLSSLVVSLTLLPVIASKLSFDFFKKQSIDNSLKSTEGKFFKIGSYWVFLVVLFNLVLHFLCDITFEIGSSFIYSLFFIMVVDIAVKIIENIIRLKKLKQNDLSEYEKSGKNIRFILLSLASFLIIFILMAPSIYMSRVDLFAPINSISNIFSETFYDNYLYDMLYPISDFVNEFFQPYEEEFGTDLFMTLSYSLGGIVFILNIFNLFSFNFLRKISKVEIDKISEAVYIRNFINNLIFVTIKFIFNLVKFWISLIIKFSILIFKPFLAIFDLSFDKFKALYHFTLIKALDNRVITLFIIFLMLVGTVFTGMALEKRLMPKIDSGEFLLTVELSPGSSIEKTEKVLGAYEKIILSDSSKVHSVFSKGGIPDEKSKINGSTIYKGEIQTILKKGIKTSDFVKRIRNEIEIYNNKQPNKIKINFNTEVSTLSDFLKSSESDIAIKVSGPNLENLQDIASVVMDKLKKMKNLSEIKTNFVSNKPKIEVKFNMNALEANNILPDEIENFLTTLIQGKTVSEFNDFDNKIDIIVNGSDDYRDNINTILSSVYNKNGVPIPLRNLITHTETKGPESIERENQQRVITVSANIKSGNFNKAISEIEENLKTVKLYKGYKVAVSGQNEEMKNSFNQLIFMFLLSLVLVYMVLASQFESLLSPFIIIFTVPMSLTGVALGLLLFNLSLNVMTAIGIIILIGIVVNDAIVKVDFIDNGVKLGLSVRNAIIEAGEKRLRPILMTTITTVFGMLPMAITSGGSSELRKPLAITVIFGLSFATLLTLIVIPVIYSLFKRDKNIK